MPAYRTKNTHISQKKLENNLDKSTKRKLTYKSGGNEVENRIKDLEKAIKEYRIDRLATMRGHMAEYVSALNPTFCKALNTVMKEQLQRQSEEIESKVKYLYLCRLHTSDYTGSYGAIIGMSGPGMYLDEKLSQVNWYPTALYTALDKDMETITKLLQQTFIRLQESELFAMKQRLSDDNWIVAESCFRTLVQNNFNLISDSKLRFEGELLILCGNYMDNLKILDAVGDAPGKKEAEL